MSHINHSCIVCHKMSAPPPNSRGRANTAMVGVLFNVFHFLHTHTFQGPHRGRSFTIKRSVSLLVCMVFLIIASVLYVFSICTVSYHAHTHTHTHTQSKDEVVLDSVQRENLKRLNMTYKSNPDIVCQKNCMPHKYFIYLLWLFTHCSNQLSLYS